MKINNSGQSAALVIVILLIIFVALYFMGYIHIPFPLGTQTGPTGGQGSAEPLSVNLSSPDNAADVFVGQNLSIVASLKNTGNSPITVSLTPFGCTFIPPASSIVTVPASAIEQKAFYFSPSSSEACTIQLSSCFPYTAYAEYSFAVQNINFTGVVPTVAPTFSLSPIAASLFNFSNSMIVGPQSANQTEYLKIQQATVSGYLNGSRLAWLDVRTTDPAYFGLGTSAPVPDIVSGSSGDINITLDGVFRNGQPFNGISAASAAAFLQYNNGLELPFILTASPAPSSAGYSTGHTIQISTGYDYCVSSNELSVSVH